MEYSKETIFIQNLNQNVMAILDEQQTGLIDSNTVSLRPTGTKWGLILGLVGAVLALIFNLTGMMDYSGTKSNIIPNIISYGAMIAIIYQAIKIHRDEELGGYITLGRCVGLGAWMGMISGVITAVFMFILMKFIQPDFANQIMEGAMNNAEAKGQDPDKVKQGMEMVGWMFSPGFFAIAGFLGSILMCVIFSLILGLIMRKEQSRPF